MAIVIAEALEVKFPGHKSRHTKQQAFLNKALMSLFLENLYSSQF